jgi:hypothetical protein
MREYPDLDLDTKDPDSEVGWRLQRAGWAVMLLVMILAVAGVFGTGLFSRAHVRGEGFEVSYPRFQRMTATNDLVVTVPVSQADRTQIGIHGDHIRSFEISNLTPQSESSMATRDGLFFTFRSVPGRPLVITFRMHASDGTFGSVSGAVSVKGRGRVEFRQVVWP